MAAVHLLSTSIECLLSVWGSVLGFTRIGMVLKHSVFLYIVCVFRSPKRCFKKSNEEVTAGSHNSGNQKEEISVERLEFEQRLSVCVCHYQVVKNLMIFIFYINLNDLFCSYFGLFLLTALN